MGGLLDALPLDAVRGKGAPLPRRVLRPAAVSAAAAVLLLLVALLRTAPRLPPPSPDAGGPGARPQQPWCFFPLAACRPRRTTTRSGGATR